MAKTFPDLTPTQQIQVLRRLITLMDPDTEVAWLSEPPLALPYRQRGEARLIRAIRALKDYVHYPFPHAHLRH